LFVPVLKNKEQSCGRNMLMEIVEENMKMFTNWQVERDKPMRKIYHTLGTPTSYDFKIIVTMNADENLPLDLEDFKLMK
jgi:hypothetical protein